MGATVSPSEPAILQGVNSLSPGRFQRLAESYAQILYPERFTRLIPVGRNEWDEPVPPWPDARFRLPDGRQDVVEATHSERWKEHLAEDLKKAKKPGSRLAGYLFLAWCGEPRGAKKCAEREQYRKQFHRLGVPLDRIEFVFQRELVAALTKPVFARVWLELLKLPGSCYPFRPIDEASTIFGQEHDAKPLVPTRKEYPDGIHRPQLTDEVEARLKDKNRRWALVRGHGAVGKTILAAQVGLARHASGYPAYYVDLEDFFRRSSEPRHGAGSRRHDF